MSNSFSLQGQTILVTGASSGIGYAICQEIDNSGGSFVAVARREDRLKELLKSCKGDGNRYIVCDLLDRNQLDKLIVEVDNVDGFVHSAGIVSLSPIKFIKDDIFDQIFELNFKCFLHISRGLVRSRKINRLGSIVGISSISGLFGMKGNGMYAASKGAMMSFSKSMANELSSKQIRVNCIAPGMVETEITNATIKAVSAEAIEVDKRKYPLGYGSADDVALPVVFLLSQASRWITAQTIVLDGGRTNTI